MTTRNKALFGMLIGSQPLGQQNQLFVNSQGSIAQQPQSTAARRAVRSTHLTVKSVQQFLEDLCHHTDIELLTTEFLKVR